MFATIGPLDFPCLQIRRSLVFIDFIQVLGEHGHFKVVDTPTATEESPKSLVTMLHKGFNTICQSQYCAMQHRRGRNGRTGMPDGQASSARAASCRSGPAAFAFLAPFLAIVLARGRGPVLVPHCPKFAQARSLSTTIHFSIAAANSSPH